MTAGSTYDAMKLKQAKAVQQDTAVTLRRGEGQEFDLVSTFALDKTGGGSVQIVQADVSGAQVPDRKYSAEVANVVWHRGIVRFMFGQERSDLKSLRSLLVVHMGPNAVRRHLASVDNMATTLSALVERLNVPDTPLVEITEDAQTQSIGLRANFVLLAIADEEACVDFYQSSAFAIRAGKHGAGKIALDPIVRVEMNFALYVSLHRELEKLRASLPKVTEETI